MTEQTWAHLMKVWPDEMIDEFHARGWWDDRTISQVVGDWALSRPDRVAYVDGATGDVTTWAEFDAEADLVAQMLRDRGVERGQPVGVLMEDRPVLHSVMVGIERAGAVSFVFPHSAGTTKLADLIELVDCRLILTSSTIRGRDIGAEVREVRDRVPALARHLVIERRDRRIVVDEHILTPGPEPVPSRWEAVGPDELFLVNFTSGTTGRPKAVMHTQNRWKYFHKKCPHLGGGEVYLTCVSAAGGMGLWSSHFTPLLEGAPVVLVPEFRAEAVLQLLEEHRVTALFAVPTQLRLLLSAESLASRDLGPLRQVHSGGERLPMELGVAFEKATGSAVLQFYGSTEAGCASGPTSASSSPEERLGSAGRAIEEMNLRLVQEDGALLTPPGRGQCAVRGPSMSPGYYRDPEANAQLFREDGWMLISDIVDVSAIGEVHVVGRVSDIIIRGGYNISAGDVEDGLLTHPRVAQAAVVPIADPMLGERICAYVSTRDGGDLELSQLIDHLAEQGIQKSLWPERLIVLESLPLSGGKVAKGELRLDAARRAESLASQGAAV